MPTRSDDGRYVGKLAVGGEIAFAVANSGGELVNFETQVPGTCLDAFTGAITLKSLYAHVPSTAIDANGAFSGTYEPGGQTKIRYRGRLEDQQVVDGWIRVVVANCTGESTWVANRVHD